MSILVQQYSSNTHVFEPWELFLEDRLALYNENASGFPSDAISSTPTVPLPLSLQAPSLVLLWARLRSRCVARSFRLSTRFERSSFQVFSQRHNAHIYIYTYISCMHDLAINKEHHDTTACYGSVPKEPILPLGAD